MVIVRNKTVIGLKCFCSFLFFFFFFLFFHDWEWASCPRLFRNKRFHHYNPEGNSVTLPLMPVPLSLYENAKFCGFGTHLPVIPTWTWRDTIICGSSFQSRIIQHRTYDESVISLWIQFPLSSLNAYFKLWLPFHQGFHFLFFSIMQATIEKSGFSRLIPPG